MLYACYDLIRPDVILEVSWRNGLHDFTMVSAIRFRECQGRANIWQPYMINFLAQQAATIELLKKDNEERKTREQSQQKNEENTPILGASRLMLTQGPSAPSPAPYGQANGIAPQTTGYRAF